MRSWVLFVVVAVAVSPAHASAQFRPPNGQDTDPGPAPGASPLLPALPGTSNEACGGGSCDGPALPCAVGGGPHSCTVPQAAPAATGGGTSTSTTTSTTAGAGSGLAPPPPPPPPPTPAEALATCPPTAAPDIGHDPYRRGLTGMETYLWASAQGPASSSATIRGYPVTCTVTPVRWRFTTGDGGAYVADRYGGPHPDHAATHVYRTPNEPGEDYELTVTVTWERSTNYGDDVVTEQAAKPYHVVEVRAALTG